MRTELVPKHQYIRVDATCQSAFDKTRCINAGEIRNFLLQAPSRINGICQSGKCDYK